MNMFYKAGLVLSALLMLSACDLRLNEHVMKARENNDLRQANRVDLVQYKHQVAFAGGKNMPSDVEYDRFDAFMRSIDMGYGDEVVLSGSSATRRDRLAAYIQRLAIPVRIETEPGDKRDVTSNTVNVTVNRHVVTPPACPNWSNFDGNENRNTPGSHYGCSVDSSLGYMIANPRDLVQGQTPGPALSKPLIDAQRRYQDGKVTKPASTAVGG